MTRRSTPVLLLLALGCNGPTPPEPTPVAPVAVPRNPNIPVEVSYPIIKDEDESSRTSSKRMVEVRLNMKVSPEILREIALDVKSKETRQYEYTLIYVYLHEDILGVKNAPWATCHFNPTLEVKIHGLTKDQEAALRSAPRVHPGKRIGAWLLDVPYTGHIVVIYEIPGAIKLLEITPERSEYDMTELPSETGRRFQAADSSDVHEVDPDGVLRLINGEGKVFAAALPLK